MGIFLTPACLPFRENCRCHRSGWLGMVKKIAFAWVAVSLLAGCSLFGEFAPAEDQGYFEPKSAAAQDPYWQRFYELEQEIARLKAKLGEPSTPVAAQANPQASESVADDFLARLRQKADQAVKVIDKAIASIDQLPAQQPSQDPAPSHEVDYAVTEISPQVAVAGSVQRNREGDVVTQVTYTQSRQPQYNYSLVYIYPEPKPWNDMWDKLEAANEQDKWRGSNPDKPSYFIYVGAYLHEGDAVKRHDSLVTILGEGPQVRTNVQSAALAAN